MVTIVVFIIIVSSVSVQVSSGGDHWGWDLRVVAMMDIVVVIGGAVIELVSGSGGH